MEKQRTDRVKHTTKRSRKRIFRGNKYTQLARNNKGLATSTDQPTVDQPAATDTPPTPSPCEPLGLATAVTTPIIPT